MLTHFPAAHAYNMMICHHVCSGQDLLRRHPEVDAGYYIAMLAVRGDCRGKRLATSITRHGMEVTIKGFKVGIVQ